MPGTTTAEPTRVLGTLLRDVMALNAEHQNFRLFGPDETESNGLGALYEVAAKAWQEEILPGDEHLATDGRVVEMLWTTTASPTRTPGSSTTW